MKNDGKNAVGGGKELMVRKFCGHRGPAIYVGARFALDELAPQRSTLAAPHGASDKLLLLDLVSLFGFASKRSIYASKYRGLYSTSIDCHVTYRLSFDDRDCFKN